MVLGLDFWFEARQAFLVLAVVLFFGICALLLDLMVLGLDFLVWIWCWVWSWFYFWFSFLRRMVLFRAGSVLLGLLRFA